MTGLTIHAYGPCMDLYIEMLNNQLTYDALKIIGFDMETMGALGKEMVFIQDARN